MKNKKARAEGLDTLRGCAVLAIVCFHYLNNTSVLRTPSFLSAQAATEYLFCGVDMFFVLSGFLIGGSLMNNKGQPRYLLTYFTHRVCRIFPLYFLWLGLFFCMLAAGGVNWGGAFPWLLTADGFDLRSYLIFAQNFAASSSGNWGPAWLGITWSLAIEMQFYVLAAFLVAAVPLRFVGVASAIIILASVMLKQWGEANSFNVHSMAVLTLFRLEGPFAGVLCAWIWRHERVQDFVIRHSGLLVPAASALLLGHYLNGNYRFFNYPISIFSVNAFVFAIVTLAFAGPSARKVNLIVRGLRWCGVRCYAIYLFHVGVLGIVSGAIFSWPPNVFPPGVGWPAVIIAFPLTLILTEISWRYIEWPSILAGIGFTRDSRSVAVRT